MDLSTRASSGGGGDSNDGGNHGRRRSGGGRPAKSVFSIRSLVGEDTVRGRRDRDVDGNDDGDQDDQGESILIEILSGFQLCVRCTHTIRLVAGKWRK